MSWSLQDVQNAIAVEVDQSATAPTSGGTDWNIRLNLINRVLIDWSNSYDWRSLKDIHYGNVTASSFVTYSLPVRFKKMDGYPKIADGQNTYEFPVVDVSQNRRYVSTDKYVNILEGTTPEMIIHSDVLTSGASVEFTYFKSVATVSSASDLVECPDPTYVVQRTLYYIYKGREDGRFPEAKVEADRILARMLENENTLGMSSVDRNVSVGSEPYKNWRVGREG
jgi:hypothetical protein